MLCQDKCIGSLKGTFGMNIRKSFWTRCAAATLLSLAWVAGASAQTYEAIDFGKLVVGSNGGNAINNAGQIISGDALGALLWNRGATSFTRLGDPSVAAYSAIGMNASGQVVGWSVPLGGGTTTPIAFQGTTAVVLPTLGGTSGAATSIKDAGLIVGQSRTAIETNPFNAGDATLWEGSAVIDLGAAVGGDNSLALSINN